MLMLFAIFPASKMSAFGDNWQGWTDDAGFGVYITNWTWEDNLTSQWVADCTKLNYPYINYIYNDFYYNGNSRSGVSAEYGYNSYGWSNYHNHWIDW